MIKEIIKKDLKIAIEKTLLTKIEGVFIEHPENPEHGDYSSNFALENFGKFRQIGFKNPLDLAEKIVKNFSQKEYLKKIEAFSPGFINFYLSEEFLQNQVKEILVQKGNYGIDKKEQKKRKQTKIQVEFISANPTGPLHVGNCRGGFAGDVLANVLKKLGYSVQQEYYINDRGVQIEKLGQSVQARYKQQKGQKAEIPEGGYQGGYIKEIAKKIARVRVKNFKEFALKEILGMIRKTTDRMGIRYNVWFSENSLYRPAKIKAALSFLKKKGLVFEKEDALWFKSSNFGDDKDRVLIKSDKESTYLFSDLAYHINKFEVRKFDKVILFWGADHHGYVPRFLGMIEAIGHKGKAEIDLCQLLRLKKAGKEIRMSKRKGEYVTIDDLIDKIGLDAARFHFLMYSLNTQMVLDLKKAKEKSVKNPVFYVQYAHARISSILEKAGRLPKKIDSSLLAQKEELDLIKKLIKFPEILLDIEKNRQLQALPVFAIELADLFHKFYEKHRVLNEDKKLMTARLGLIKTVQIILSETLAIMGVSTPEKM